MADTHAQQKGNVVAPTIAGIAIGAAVAAGAVILSDKKKRKQVVQHMHTMKGKATDILQQAKTKVADMQQNANEIMDEATGDIEDILDEPNPGKKN